MPKEGMFYRNPSVDMVLGQIWLLLHREPMLKESMFFQNPSVDMLLTKSELDVDLI